MKKIILFMLLAAFLCGCAGTENAGESTEVWMLNVGKGDAIIVETRGKTFLIDAARPERWGIVQTFLKEKGISRLDAVFITHADEDHVGGVTLLAQSDIEVGAWYIPAFSMEKKSPALDAARQRGQSVTRLKAGDEAEGVFRVLAPSVPFADKEDNNSLVMALETAAGRLLLTGDMEYPEEAELMSREKDLTCAVLKVPNHGDDDTLSMDFLRASRPRLALISTDPYEKPGTPDAALLYRLEAIGAAVFRTDKSGAGIHLTMNAKGARAEYMAEKALPELGAGVYIELVNEKEEKVIVVNESDAALDMTGWYLYSSRGDEAFLFPAGTMLSPGGTLTVGSLSTKEPCDMIWQEKNVIHNSKSDTVALYDACGRFVTSADNGL